MNRTEIRKARLIAYYLPQFHPIPENDEWWGKGFTEWTNVVKAKPLFKGHQQPRLPADLGFYDLRLPETRFAQAEMAVKHGVEAFCYWHYWFAGKQLLDTPFKEVLRSGQPGLSFCLGWANDTWTGIWHGSPERILIEQTYPGLKDIDAHFYALLDAFSDDRYLTVDGQPLFLVYQPFHLPEPRRFIERWKNLALQAGLKGIYFVANIDFAGLHPEEEGYDASVLHNPIAAIDHMVNPFAISFYNRCYRYFRNPLWFAKIRSRGVTLIEYAKYMKHAFTPSQKGALQFPCVVPNWDNTPRCGVKGFILNNSTPALFRNHLRDTISQIQPLPLDKRIVFIKSWNEWAEGNYLEPDQQFGSAYLQVCREEALYP
ncbi:MAG: glycosyltransferase WbsX family protein [Nitrospirota bacterium]